MYVLSDCMTSRHPVNRIMWLTGCYDQTEVNNIGFPLVTKQYSIIFKRTKSSWELDHLTCHSHAGPGIAEGDENCKKFLQKTMIDSFTKVGSCPSFILLVSSLASFPLSSLPLPHPFHLSSHLSLPLSPLPSTLPRHPPFFSPSPSPLPSW